MALSSYGADWFQMKLTVPSTTPVSNDVWTETREQNANAMKGTGWMKMVAPAQVSKVLQIVTLTVECSMMKSVDLSREDSNNANGLLADASGSS